MQKVVVGAEWEMDETPPGVGVRLGGEFISAHWNDMAKELDRIPHTWQYYWTKESMFECLMLGAWQAWGFGPEGEVRVTVFTTIVNYPVGPVLQICLAFGHGIDALLPMMEATFERVADRMGCAHAEIFGRPGWERKLKKFKRVAVVLRREAVKQGVH